MRRWLLYVKARRCSPTSLSKAHISCNSQPQRRNFMFQPSASHSQNMLSGITDFFWPFCKCTHCRTTNECSCHATIIQSRLIKGLSPK